jgi:signal recognition particle subunit SRP72
MAPALEPLFRTLSDDITAGQFKKAVDVCDKILAIVPKDEDALKCKCLCLIELNKFADALAFIEENNSVLKNIELETAYCLYKERKHQEALDIINKLKDLSPVAKHLQAQTFYRLGEYEKVAEIYKQLYDSNNPSPELLVNIAAVNTCRNLIDEHLKKLSSDEAFLAQSYELGFNLSCFYIRRGDLQFAEKLLKQAESTYDF